MRVSFFARNCWWLACWLALSAGVAAQGSGVVEGYVRNREGKAVENIKIVLKGGGGAEIGRTQTDNEGHYMFFGIGAGTFFVSMEPEGAQPENRMVQMLAEEESPHRREDFSLDLAASPNALGLGEPVFNQKVPEEAEQAYKEGLEHLKNSRRDEALAAFQQATAKFPAYFAALRASGMEYLQRGDVAKTGEACQRASSVNKNSASARFCLGWAFYQAEKLDDASRELTEAGKLNPRAAETFWYLGMTEIERKQWKPAEQAFAAFQKLHTRDDRPMLHMYLTSVYDNLNRPADAARSLEAYLKAVPEKDRTQKLKDLLAKLKKKAG